MVLIDIVSPCVACNNYIKLTFILLQEYQTHFLLVLERVFKHTNGMQFLAASNRLRRLSSMESV